MRSCFHPTLAFGLFTLALIQTLSLAQPVPPSAPPPKEPPAPFQTAATPIADAEGFAATPNEVLANATNLIRRKEHLLADQILDSLLDKPNLLRPIRAEAIYLRGRIALAEDRPTEAVIWFRRYMQDFADQTMAPYVNFLLAQTYKRMGAYERARENFIKALDFVIKTASSLTLDDYTSSERLAQAAGWEVAESEYLNANWKRAIELYQIFQKQHPSLEILITTANYRLADCHYQTGDMPAAIQGYELALAQSPFHPFATESWLRLVALYGQIGEQRKQVEALQCFIWLVNTLSPEDKLYWQRRCADLLLIEYKEKPERQIPLLEAILAFDTSEEWMRMLDFYLSLVNRQIPNVAEAGIPAPSDKARDNWRAWLDDFNAKIKSIRERTQAFDKETSLPKPAN